jgi:hypothetical protein
LPGYLFDFNLAISPPPNRYGQMEITFAFRNTAAKGIYAFDIILPANP